MRTALSETERMPKPYSRGEVGRGGEISWDTKDAGSFPGSLSQSGCHLETGWLRITPGRGKWVRNLKETLALGGRGSLDKEGLTSDPPLREPRSSVPRCGAELSQASPAVGWSSLWASQVRDHKVS